MNILVDGRMLCRYSGGITTFILGALEEWIRLCPQNLFYVLLPKKADNVAVLWDKYSNLHYITFDNPLFARIPNIIILQASVPVLCAKYNIDLYYSPVPHIPFCLPRKVRTLVTVHDVVNIEMAHTMAWTNRMASKFFFSWAVRNADHVWCNSYYTKSKVEEYFPERKCKDVIVGCAVDRGTYRNLCLSDEDKINVIKELGAKGRYLLFVGSLEPRKNLSFLLRVFPEIYKKLGLQLVVVGAKKWKSSDLNDIVCAQGYPKENVVFCNYISNDMLARVYSAAECFVSTSLNEGFGMPQLEAMLCGCPVVTAGNSAMVEVAKGKSAACTVSGFEPAEWIRAISDMVNRHPQVDTEQLMEYDWNVVMNKVINTISPNT